MSIIAALNWGSLSVTPLRTCLGEKGAETVIIVGGFGFLGEIAVRLEQSQNQPRFRVKSES